MIVTGLAWQMTTCSISRWSPARAYPSRTAATPLSKAYSDLTRQSIFDLLSLLRPTHAFRSTLLPATAEKISFSPAVAENAATYGPTMIPVRADVPPTPCGETHHGSY